MVHQKIDVQSLERTVNVNHISRYVEQILAIDSESLTALEKFRLYTEGEQTEQFTLDQLSYLGRENDDDFSAIINICPTIIRSESDRLIVNGQTVTVNAHDLQETESDETVNDELAKYLQLIWRLSNMDVITSGIHFAGIRDGDVYLIVDWNSDNNAPEYTLNTAYDGTDGTYVAYSELANQNSAIYAFKVWQVETVPSGTGITRRRCNIYYPNRVEHFITNQMGGWIPYIKPAEGENRGIEPYSFLSPIGEKESYVAGVMWNTDDDTPDGNALGLPVFHYPHRAYGMATGKSGLSEIVPSVQDAINIVNADILAVSQLMGFPVNYATGYNPSQKNSFEIYPAALIHATNADAGFGQLPAANPMTLIEARNDYIKTAAMLTSTPLWYFNQTGHLPAADTIQGLQEQLRSKVIKAQNGLSVFYREAARFAIMLEWLYGGGQRITSQLSLQIIQEMDIKIEWETPIPRNEREAVEIAATKVERLGIPREQAWSELAYSQQEIENMRGMNSEIRGQVLGALSDAITGANANVPVAPPSNNGNGANDTANRIADLEAVGNEPTS